MSGSLDADVAELMYVHESLRRDRLFASQVRCGQRRAVQNTNHNPVRHWNRLVEQVRLDMKVTSSPRSSANCML